MAVDDVIKAARNMARTTNKVLDNSRTTTKALNKIVSEHGTALNNARKIAGSNTATKALNNIVENHGAALNNARKIANANTTTKTINNIVEEHGTALNNAKKVANANTTVPSRYDARGNYQQALEKAKEVANTNTTTRAINNNTRNTQNTASYTTDNTPRMPVINNNVNYNTGPQASPIIRNTPIDNSSNGPKYGPRVENQRTTTLDPVDTPETLPEAKPNPFENTNTNTNEQTKRSWKDYGNKYFGGITDTYNGTRAGDGFWNSLEAAHKNADGTMRWDRVAGTYAAAALGARVLSGGGLTKDKYGNSNLPGIPFI